MGCINSKKDISDINPNFYRVVHIDESSGTQWCGHLEISPKELILHRKGREPTKWSLQHLRRYGFDSDVFTFEAGRRCPTGEGIFAFKCRRAENLFHVMQNYIQGIALNDDINQQLADMNLSSSLVSNRFNRQSVINSRSNNSIQQSHNSNIQQINNTNFANINRNSDTFSTDGNYLEPTPMRNNTGVRYSSGGIGTEPNSPGSPNSFTIILEVTQLNQSQQHQQQQQNYANSNIYHEFPLKSGESNNNLLTNNKLSLDIPPQEPAPAVQNVSTASATTNCNPMLCGRDDIQKTYNQNIVCSSSSSAAATAADYDDGSRMYVNITPSEMNFSFPRLSSTQSLSTRCYENTTIVASATVDNEKTELETQVLNKEEERRVNYIVLDLDNMPPPSTSTTSTSLNTGGNNIVTDTSSGVGVGGCTTATTVCNSSNNNSQIKSMISGGTSNFLPIESPKSVTLGYATIDFNKTVALSNSTIPSIESDSEGSRRTRHSSTAMRQSNSTSD